MADPAPTPDQQCVADDLAAALRPFCREREGRAPLPAGKPVIVAIDPAVFEQAEKALDAYEEGR